MTKDKNKKSYKKSFRRAVEDLEIIKTRESDSSDDRDL
jgi:hypothetical protein